MPPRFRSAWPDVASLPAGCREDTAAVPSTATLTRDTTLCVSLAGRPSNIGTRFHNFLYDELRARLRLQGVHHRRTWTAAVAGIRGARHPRLLGCRCRSRRPASRCSTSSIRRRAAIDSVNTIVNDSGRLRGYNTDYLGGAARWWPRTRFRPSWSSRCSGSGGMAKAVAAALRDAGFDHRHGRGARNEGPGAALAERYGFDWRAVGAPPKPARLLVNATPIGMAGGPQEDALSFARELVDPAEVVFDVVALPPQTPLVRLGVELGLTTLTGAEVIAVQAAEQFVLYTGVRPSPDQVRRASEFSRG